MSPDQFCYWLQGYAEIGGPVPTEAQWQIIKDHLQLVFTKVTPQRAPRPIPAPQVLDQIDEITHAVRAAKDAFPPQSGGVRCCTAGAPSSELPQQAAQAQYCVRASEPGVYRLEATKGLDTVGEVLTGASSSTKTSSLYASAPFWLEADRLPDGPIC